MEAFWFISAKLGDFGQMFGPLLAFVAICAWLYKAKSKAALLALLGGMLYGVAHMLHLLVPEVTGVNFGGYVIPGDNQNALVYFFYRYGFTIGLLFIWVALAIHFISHAKVNTKSHV